MNNLADFKVGNRVRVLAKSFKESGISPHSKHGDSHSCIGEIGRVWKHAGNRIVIRPDRNSGGYMGQFYPSELEKINEGDIMSELRFKVGDKVALVSEESADECGSLSRRGHEIEYLEITRVETREYGYVAYNKDGARVNSCYGCLNDKHLVPYDDKSPVLPEFVRLSRNTELFRKGSVFQRFGDGYTAIDKENTLLDTGATLTWPVNVATVKRLPNTFVAVTKFDPAYVTAEENERLQAALKAPTKKGKK